MVKFKLIFKSQNKFKSPKYAASITKIIKPKLGMWLATVAVKFATCIVSSRGLFLLSVYSCRYQFTLRIPVSYLIFEHMRKFYWQGRSEGNSEQAQQNKPILKIFSENATDHVHCKLKPKLKKQRENSTQLDVGYTDQAESDKCCHYTKRNCVSTSCRVHYVAEKKAYWISLVINLKINFFTVKMIMSHVNLLSHKISKCFSLL